jgi:hypothetical protein
MRKLGVLIVGALGTVGLAAGPSAALAAHGGSTCTGTLASGTNTINGNLVCHGNSPAPQIGDSEGQPNVVTGRKVDQCAGL